MNMGSNALRISPAAHLQRIVSVLEKAPAISYILDSDLRFLYCNAAWDEFAVENGAPALARGAVIGEDLFQFVPPVLKSFYSRIFDEVRRTGLVWSHIYQCSSPDNFRTFRMLIHRLVSGGLLVTNALTVERPHAHRVEPEPDIYRNEHGLICMCSHCRCSRRCDHPEQWDFVPAHFALVPFAVTHGLCPVCRAYFYPTF